MKNVDSKSVTTDQRHRKYHLCMRVCSILRQRLCLTRYKASVLSWTLFIETLPKMSSGRKYLASWKIYKYNIIWEAILIFYQIFNITLIPTVEGAKVSPTSLENPALRVSYWESFLQSAVSSLQTKLNWFMKFWRPKIPFWLDGLDWGHWGARQGV